MEEYLTIKELSRRIKYERQTIYNLIHRKVFIQGKHFLKPTPKKILFKWSEVQAWIGEEGVEADGGGPTAKVAGSIQGAPKDGRTSLIRI